jgi:hypothetical protein
MFKRSLGIIFITLFTSVILPYQAFASSDLFFTPARGSYLVDEPIPVKMVVKSSEKLSAVEASVEFDPKMLEVEIKSISKNVSWVVIPSVDNTRGLISFSGVMSKDIGLEEDLVELSVIGLRSGSPEIRFLSGASTVASDGTGGNTLGKITNALFDILVENGTSDSLNKNSGGEVLGATDTELVISSPDILDQSAWYSLKNINFNWTLPSGISQVLTGLTKKAEDIGFRSVANGTTTKIINDIDEGEWYFHITPKGKDINDTKHFRVAIDREAPLISTTTERERADFRDPNIKYYIEATDKLSGIDHFEMVYNGGVSSRWEDNETHEYSFKADGPGDHSLTISAFDKANNRSETHVNFRIEALESPLIKLKRNTIPEASPIIAEITGLPNASVVVTFEGGVVHHDDTISLDDNGKANYILKESVLPGNYQLSAVQKLQNGASSLKNSHIELIVKPSIIGYIGRNLAVSIALVPIVLLFTFYLLWRFGVIAWYFRRKLNRSVIQKVAPLELMSKRDEQYQGRYNKIETSPLQIKRVSRKQDPNDVIDLRRR